MNDNYEFPFTPNIERDEKGRITKRNLSSEEAAEMGRRKHAKPKEEELKGLIDLFGFTLEDVPVDIRLLAEKAISNKPGDMSALSALIKRRGFLGEAPTHQEVVVGKPCPGCGHLVLPQKFQRQLNKIIELYEAETADTRAKS